MYVGEFYFQFPLFTIKPNFMVVAGYLAVFTEQIHAERFRGDNTVFTISDLDGLAHIVDVFEPHVEGICFDPVTTRGRWESKISIEWELLRKAIDLDKGDPDEHV